MRENLVRRILTLEREREATKSRLTQIDQEVIAAVAEIEFMERQQENKEKKGYEMAKQ